MIYSEDPHGTRPGTMKFVPERTNIGFLNVHIFLRYIHSCLSGRNIMVTLGDTPAHIFIQMFLFL